MAITDDVDSHVAPDLLDPENYLVILSVKNRGSRAEATPIALRCTKTNQYSTYRLLQYVATTIRQYRESRNYISGVLEAAGVYVSDTARYPALTLEGSNFRSRHGKLV